VGSRRHANPTAYRYRDPMTERACENCGGTDDDELLPVRRVYLRDDSPDGGLVDRVCDEVELWCVSCASQYPHRPVDPSRDDLD